MNAPATDIPLKMILKTCGAVVASSIMLAFMSQPMAAQIDRTKQPTPGPAPKAVFPKFEEFTLSNGLKVFLVPDNRPLVTFRMQVRGGDAVDGKLIGLSEATADMLTRGGTAKVSAQEFAEQIDFVGGSVGASTAEEMISITASGLKKHLPTILGLFGDAIKNPAFNAEEFDKYKNEQITGLKSAKSRADFLAEYAVNKLLYGDEPWGTMPTEETVNSLTVADLSKFHKTYFVPGNASLAVVGNFTKDELQKQLESTLGDWKKGAMPAIAKPKLQNLSGRRVIIVDRPASVQSSIRMIGKGPQRIDPERPKTYIMNSIFGGGTGLGNRLASNLREKHAYTYTPGSYFNSNSYTGYFLAAADVRNSVTDSAVKEILYEVNRIQTEPVPQDELDRNIQSAVGGFLMSIADPATTAVGVQAIDFYNLPKDYYQRLLPAYQSVTQQDVQRLAKKYMNPNDMSIVVVGKADEIKSQMGQFGKVEVWNTDLQPMGAATGVSSIDGMNAEQLWGKVVDAMGGKRKLQAITSLKTSMKAEVNAGPQKFSGTFQRVEVAPNKKYEKLDLGVIKQESWSNGSKVTMAQGPQTQELSGEELDKELEDSHILAWAYVQEMGGKPGLKEKKDINGRSTYITTLTLPKKGTTTYYIDAKTLLPYKEETSDGKVVNYEEWVTVADGVKQPGVMSVEPQPGVTIKFSEAKYEVNPKVDDKMFNKQ
jgi:predicted Zn-dependent peptidase